MDINRIAEILKGLRAVLAPDCEQISEAGASIVFLRSGISGEERWKMLGSAGPRLIVEDDEEPQLLQIELMLLDNINPEVVKEAQQRLQELTLLSAYGSFFIDEGKLYFRYSYPIIGKTPDQIRELFEMTTREIFGFIDFYYAYLLVCTIKPERATLAEYTATILEAGSADG